MRALLLLCLFLAACIGPGTKPARVASTATVSEEPEEPGLSTICWSGMINKSIPVLLYYTVHDRLIVGAITFLNTKTKTPIKVLGSIDEEGSYRLLEFEPDGNISGIMVCNRTATELSGTWFSPKNRRELSLALSRKDTVIMVPDITTNAGGIYGSYHYQYSEDGPQGDLAIDQLQDGKAAFSIFSVTSAPGRNIADVEDTIAAPATAFSYDIPDSDSCGFKVAFYKDFAVVSYTRGYCLGQFGFHATIDGIFLKVD